MSGLTLESVMLGATLLLTVLNIFTNMRTTRQNEIATAPALNKIHLELAETRKDIQYVMGNVAPVNDILDRLTKVESAVSVLKDSNNQIKEVVERLTILETAFKMMQKDKG